jgi:P2-related tail formation protein
VLYRQGSRWRIPSLAALGALASVAASVVLGAAPPADAASKRVACIGGEDTCRAVLSIAGPARERMVTVELSHRNLTLAGVRTSPRSSKRALEISDAVHADGGSEFRFRLTTTERNPEGAELRLEFAANEPAPTASRQTANAIFDVGAGMTVRIIGGGADTSNCTSNETVTTFQTIGGLESHQFGFEVRGSGRCGAEPSWSDFQVRITDAKGARIGSGTMGMRQFWLYFGDYEAFCSSYQGKYAWSGVECRDNRSNTVRITRAD